MESTTYKCPHCGTAMIFNSQTQMLGCPSCGANLNVVDYDNYIKELDKEFNTGTSYNHNGTSNSAINNANADSNYSSDNDNTRGAKTDADEFTDTENMKVFHCQSCGAQLVTDKFTSATFCSYCGNPTLVEERLEGKFSPRFVIPFKIDKEQAVRIYKDWLKQGPLTPKALSHTSTIEKISGVYVPFWLYDYNANAKLNAAATRVRTQRRGDTEYIYTDHFQLYRDVSTEFDYIPADASEKMPDERMDKLEPFNYGELVPFKGGYLQGYLSERYNYTDDELNNRAKTRAKEYIDKIARDTMVGYSTVTIERSQLDVRNKKSTYVLLPVWMLNFTFNGKKFSFYLNGQTGKIVADRPVSKARTISIFILIFVITLIITMIGGLLLS